MKPIWRSVQRNSDGLKNNPTTRVARDDGVCVCVCVSVWNDCYVTNTDSGLFLSRWTVHVHQRK